jgi:hypothetical protein
MLLLIIWTRVRIITPCWFHCLFIMMILLLVLKKWKINLDMSYFVAFVSSKYFLARFLFPSFLKFENLLFPCFFHIKSWNCFVISAKSSSISSSSSSSSLCSLTWWTTLNAIFFFWLLSLFLPFHGNLICH